MKLIRWGLAGEERPGLVDAAGGLRDLSGVVRDIAGRVLSDEGLATIAGTDPEGLPQVPEGARLGPCIGGVGKIMCIGLNYADHAEEAGMDPPPEPILFLKATSAISGPFDAIPVPRGSRHTDWEAELGVVIGRAAKHVTEADALSYVAGYCCGNDVSERHYQTKRSGQWTKGKSCDGFAPLGPWLVTRDAVPDPQALDIWLDLNGERRQDGSTATMIFGVAHLVAYLSDLMTLHPGDVILTGTPPGVGMAADPPRYLGAGDSVAMGIAGLGEMHQEVVAT